MADGFQKVNAADRTDGLSGSGILSVYLGEPPARGRLFGHEGYFLRILGERRARRGALPRVTRVLTNVAGITQSHRELDQLFAALFGQRRNVQADVKSFCRTGPCFPARFG